MDHYLNKLCRVHIPNDKYQDPRSLVLWYRKSFFSFSKCVHVSTFIFVHRSYCQNYFSISVITVYIITIRYFTDLWVPLDFHISFHLGLVFFIFVSPKIEESIKYQIPTNAALDQGFHTKESLTTDPVSVISSPWGS